MLRSVQRDSRLAEGATAQEVFPFGL